MELILREVEDRHDFLNCADDIYNFFKVYNEILQNLNKQMKSTNFIDIIEESIVDVFDVSEIGDAVSLTLGVVGVMFDTATINDNLTNGRARYNKYISYLDTVYKNVSLSGYDAITYSNIELAWNDVMTQFEQPQALAVSTLMWSTRLERSREHWDTPIFCNGEMKM